MFPFVVQLEVDTFAIGWLLDDLVGFEDAWRGSARKHLPGWTEQSRIAHTTGMYPLYVKDVFVLHTATEIKF